MFLGGRTLAADVRDLVPLLIVFVGVHSFKYCVHGWCKVRRTHIKSEINI